MNTADLRRQAEQAAIKESLTTDRWREVSEEEFFSRMKPLDVTPYPTGDFPFTSLWKTRNGTTIARSVDYRSGGALRTRYYL